MKKNQRQIQIMPTTVLNALNINNGEIIVTDTIVFD